MSKIWCFLVDHKKRPLLGKPFSVLHSSVRNIGELKQEIKKTNDIVLADIDADCLKVWRLTEELLVDEVDAPGTDKAARRISKIDFSNTEEVRNLCNAQDVAGLGLSRYETLIIERTGMFSNLIP